MDADKAVQANLKPRCPKPDDPGCIVAVYEGARTITPKLRTSLS